MAFGVCLALDGSLEAFGLDERQELDRLFPRDTCDGRLQAANNANILYNTVF